jgi:thiamine biosynthesis lipoprotein
MHDMHDDAMLGRRGMIARLAGVALSFTGLDAVGRFTRATMPAPKWDDRFELAVDFEIASQEGFRYHRPYVAVWVEDPAGKRVRTLSLWVNTNGRGPRYIRELRRWIVGEREQEDAGGPDLVASMSGATRPPGQYSVVWNGRDDRGTLVEQGPYRIVIEAAREHGSYQLMQQDLTLGAKPVAADLSGNQEIGRARVEYRRRK